MPCVRVENFPELRNFRPTKRLLNRINIPKPFGCHEWLAGNDIRSQLVHLELKRRERNWIQVFVTHYDPRDPERMFVQKTRVQWYDQAHVGLSRNQVDSSHRTEMWGAPKFTRALFLFWFKRREMSAKWFRTECSQLQIVWFMNHIRRALIFIANWFI